MVSIYKITLNEYIFSVTTIAVILTITCVYLVFKLVIQTQKLNKFRYRLKVKNEQAYENLQYELHRRRLSFDRNNITANYINSVFQTMEDGFVVFDESQNIILINPSAIKLLNADKGVFFKADSKLYGEKFQEMTRICQKVLETDTSISEIVKFDNDKFYRYTVSKIFDKYSDGKFMGLLVSVTDISETEQSDRLKKEFIENISHEFRTPMTLITGYIEMLRMWHDLEDDVRERAYDVIEFETTRLNSLVDELVTLSKVDGDFKPETSIFDVNKTLALLVESLREFEKKRNVQLNLIKHKDEILLSVSKNYFIQAVSNIIENAIKYTYKKDTIEIKISLEEDLCKIEIKDNGPGIDEGHLHRIYDRFYRLEKDRNSESGGSGLGLAISKDMITSMDGSLKVISEVNVGTTFIIEIPIFKGE